VGVQVEGFLSLTLDMKVVKPVEIVKTTLVVKGQTIFFTASTGFTTFMSSV